MHLFSSFLCQQIPNVARKSNEYNSRLPSKIQKTSKPVKPVKPIKPLKPKINNISPQVRFIMWLGVYHLV